MVRSSHVPRPVGPRDRHEEKGFRRHPSCNLRRPPPRTRYDVGHRDVIAAGRLGADLVASVRAGEWQIASSIERQLAGASLAQLSDALPKPHDRLAFWLNIYNGAVRRALASDPQRLRQRLRFFRRPIISLGGTELSPDAIEHGMLRRGRWKLGLGYLANPFPSKLERALRVARVDPRIHFALNCGARSCPPIATYEAGTVETQLDAATRAYLSADVRRDGDAIVVPRMFLWYLGDFGGPGGMRSFLDRHWNGPLGPRARIRFGQYDWTPAVDRVKMP